MSSRRQHVFPLNKLKQGIGASELLSFDLFKLSLEILAWIKYGVIVAKLCTFIYSYIKVNFNYKRNRFLLHLLVWYQHRNNETTLNNSSTAPMSSQYFHQHQDRSKTNIQIKITLVTRELLKAKLNLFPLHFRFLSSK